MRIPKLLTLALFTVVLAVSNPIYGLSSVEQQQIVPLFQSSCGNGVCDPGENTDNCPSDCSVFIGGYCGDGTCDSGEEGSCPQDCGVSCVGQTCIEGYFFDWESCTCVPSEDSCLPQACSPVNISTKACANAWLPVFAAMAVAVLGRIPSTAPRTARRPPPRCAAITTAMLTRKTTDPALRIALPPQRRIVATGCVTWLRKTQPRAQKTALHAVAGTERVTACKGKAARTVPRIARK